MHLMSEHYDHTLSPEHLFEIQDDIAARVAAEIADPHGVLSRVGGRRNRIADTSNMDAYDSVLAFYAYLREPTPEGHAEKQGSTRGRGRPRPENTQVRGPCSRSPISTNCAVTITCARTRRLWTARSRQQRKQLTWIH